MPVREIRLHEDLWSAASALRRQEWRALIADLLDEGELAPHAERILVAVEESAFVLSLHSNENIESHSLPHTIVRPHLDEYLEIVKKMVEEDIPAMRLEALDMAKKVVHDRAARAIASHAPMLARGHEAFRRLFTLLVALAVDTTKLPAAHRHAQLG